VGFHLINKKGGEAAALSYSQDNHFVDFARSPVVFYEDSVGFYRSPVVSYESPVEFYKGWVEPYGILVFNTTSA
jgi:hypothetical protein